MADIYLVAQLFSRKVALTKMPNLKDIKSRISSVQNTKKITKAMKMVAAAKVKKAENTVKASRPFSDELLNLFRKLVATVEEFSVTGLKVEIVNSR